MRVEQEAEICVLGGGPAGAIAARRLALLGHAVVLVDRGSSGNRPPAESLAPSIFPVLDSLGLRDCAEAAAFGHEQATLLLWESGDLRVKSAHGPRSLLVGRDRFDRLLRQTAADAGVRLLAPAKGHAPRRLATGRWAIPIASRDSDMVVKARFLVDARGRRPRDGRPSEREPTSTAALWGLWTLPKESLAQTGIEAGPGEWLWGSPVPDGQYAATVFLDAARIAGLNGEERIDLYQECLARSRLFATLVGRGSRTTHVRVCDATARIAVDLIGADFIRIGEAAFAIDPLSSQGVQAAFLSAIQGSAAVHTLLARAADPEPAFQFYRMRQRDAAAKSRRTAAELYAAQNRYPGGTFWARRSVPAEPPRAARPPLRPATRSPTTRLRISPELRIAATPVLSGEFITVAPALNHPSLEQPVAYAEGHALAPLIDDIDGESTIDDILRRWTRRVSPEAAWRIITWLQAAGILLPRSTPA